MKDNSCWTEERGLVHTTHIPMFDDAEKMMTTKTRWAHIDREFILCNVKYNVIGGIHEIKPLTKMYGIWGN